MNIRQLKKILKRSEVIVIDCDKPWPVAKRKALAGAYLKLQEATEFKHRWTGPG